MSISTKYPRSYHYDFSLGTTSDDRINFEWREDVKEFDTLLHTEKLDGENTCIKHIGLFARSHAAPTVHPWANHLKQKHAIIKEDLKSCNIEIFGENLYATHSIIYPELTEHFYVFAVRSLDRWLSWEETRWYATFFDFPTVPVLGIQPTNNVHLIQDKVNELVSQPSVFGSIQVGTNEPCTREGVVSRNIESYSVEDFKNNVFKYVRKGHVQTDVHWSKNWVRAKLKHEQKK